MTNDLVPQNAQTLPQIQVDEDYQKLVRRTYAPSATNDEWQLFLNQATRKGLEPGDQLVFSKFKGRVAFITTIDGLRLIADRTGLYAGNLAATFEGRQELSYYDDYAKKHVSMSVPVKATVTVLKIVQGEPRQFSASVYWDEYYPGDRRGHMYRKMPHRMLEKCAEAAALRKAFPADMSGLYTKDEMMQSDFPTDNPVPQNVQIETGEIVDVKPRPVPQPVPQKIAVPQTQVAKPSEGGGFVVGIAREDLAKVTEPTVGSVVNAMVATGLYRARKHAINYIKKHIDLPAAYYNGDTLLLDNRVKRDSAQDMLTKAINHELKKKANEEEE